MILFEDVELFKAAVKVCAVVIPRIALPMYIRISPSVCEITTKVSAMVHAFWNGELSMREAKCQCRKSKAHHESATYTSPLSGLTFANAYKTCVSLSAVRSCGLYFLP